jgi:NH3-dependent NAD+ synthetase
MDEVKLNILETKEVRAFNTIEWITKQIDGVKREFEKDYDLANITVGISAGIPSGVTGSLTVTLTKKEKERRKE